MGLTLSIQALLRKEPMKILMVGLDGAGKTALLYKLQLGKIVTTITTTGLHVKKLEHENISITAWDVGRKSTVNHFLASRVYCQDKHGLIFLVDSNDRDRIAEARAALHTMLNQDGLLNVVLLVFANKQDLPTSMSAGEIEDKLGLFSLQRRYWRIYNCCATTGEGLYEGLDWFSKCISYQRWAETIVR